MKITIFGLTISSSWGNGHATLWRGLCRALIARGHDVIFYEKDVPYYAAHRDLEALDGGELVCYRNWSEVRHRAFEDVSESDVALTTSYCPDAIPASEVILDSNALKAFYDLDTPVTFSRLARREHVDYLPEEGLVNFDLVLSYTGGGALTSLQDQLGAKRVAPLYGSVDPAQHHPVGGSDSYRSDFSYLGTYAPDRQRALEELFIESARRRPAKRFLIGGAQYPREFPWTDNIFFVQHLPPSEHPAFFSSSRLTLNVTREAMARMGYCPSGRLFEAAACGVPILSDTWDGLEQFYTPGVEILVARNTSEALSALDLTDSELKRLSTSARERTLSEHTAERRVIELEQILESAYAPPVGA